jgi:hypothetical protein
MSLALSTEEIAEWVQLFEQHGIVRLEHCYRGTALEFTWTLEDPNEPLEALYLVIERLKTIPGYDARKQFIECINQAAGKARDKKIKQVEAQTNMRY